jgi:endo-alpha-1,4-polygalactosaminidase (GH114 family)
MKKTIALTDAHLEGIYVFLASTLRRISKQEACKEIGLDHVSASHKYHYGLKYVKKFETNSKRLEHALDVVDKIHQEWRARLDEQITIQRKSEIVYGKEIARLQGLLESKEVQDAVIYDQSAMNAEEYDRLTKEELIAEVLKCKSAIASMNNLFNKSYRRS